MFDYLSYNRLRKKGPAARNYIFIEVTLKLLSKCIEIHGTDEIMDLLPQSNIQKKSDSRAIENMIRY
jgi:hypothetical protein